MEHEHIFMTNKDEKRSSRGMHDYWAFVYVHGTQALFDTMFFDADS